MRGFSKAIGVFDKVIELVEMGEDVESIARKVGRSGTTVKTLIAIHHATKKGRVVGFVIDRLSREEDK